MLIGVVAHAHGPVWEIAEHAAPARRLLRSRHASILLFPTSEERLYAEPVKQTKAENFTCTLLFCYTENAYFDSRMDFTVKTKDISAYRYIEIRYFL